MLSVEEESSTSISFAGSGTLTRVYVEEGQAVRAGQLIAEMDKTQASTLSCFDRKSTAAMKSSVLMSGEAVRRGSPLLSAVSGATSDLPTHTSWSQGQSGLHGR